MMIVATVGARRNVTAVLLLGFVLVGCDHSAALPFDAATWQKGEVGVTSSQDAPRRRMADSLVADRVLIGQTKVQVERMLGPATKTSKFSDYGLVYWLGPERSFMSIDSEWLVIAFDSAGVATDAEVIRD